MNKCAINVNTKGYDNGETLCMQKCFGKFFDSQMLVDKEIEFHTFGNPYQS